MMLRLCLVVAVVVLLFSAGAVRAQPLSEGPPLPPETERTVSGRVAAVGGKGGGVSASGRLGGSSPSPSPNTSATTSSSGLASAGASAEEALRVFPPAPPPPEPGPPEPPTTALTSFAPAPAPPPGGAPKPPDIATDMTRETTSTNLAPAAVSGRQDAAASDSRRSGDYAVGSDASRSGDYAAATNASRSGDFAAGSDASPSGENVGYVPSGDERWSASALAGVGVTFDNTIAGVNPLGFGFGVRADYRVLPKWSLGARMLYFVGGSVELPTSDLAMQSWLIAAEGAYVIALDQVLIQPGIALGLHVREIDYRGFAGVIGGPEMLIPPDTTRLGLYVAPGVNVSVPLGQAAPSLAPLIVGADVRLDLAFGRSVTSNIQLLVLAGFRF
jgi:hypothetical protein